MMRPYRRTRRSWISSRMSRSQWMRSIKSVTSGSPRPKPAQRTPQQQPTPKLRFRIFSSTIRRARKQRRHAATWTFSSTSKRPTHIRSRNSTINKNIIAPLSSTTTKSFVSSRDQRKAMKPKNELISCAQNLGTLRFSLLCPLHKVARKRPTHMAGGLPEPSPQSRVRQITKRRYLRPRLILRYRRRLPLRPIRLPRLNHCCLCRARARVRIRPLLPAPRPLQERPPHRHLESLIRDSVLLGLEWLPWLSHRTGKAILST